MTSDEATGAVIDAMEQLELPYMLVGSLSTNYYGVPRSTKDADFVIELEGRPLSAIAQAVGGGFQLDPQASFERVTGTTRYILRVVGIPFTIELFLLSDDPHDRERFARRRRVRVEEREVSMPTAEDTIITKLRWAIRSPRSKDNDDVRDVIAVQKDRIDWEYVYHWCEVHGTRKLLDEIRATVPEI